MYPANDQKLAGGKAWEEGQGISTAGYVCFTQEYIVWWYNVIVQHDFVWDMYVLAWIDHSPQSTSANSARHAVETSTLTCSMLAGQLY